MIKSRYFIFLMMLSSLFAGKYLAVIELEAAGVTKMEAQILTQRLTSKMIELSDYTIVERANIDKILKEQKFQHSGCTNSECAVEIGQLLNADLTVIGNASKFGSTYTLDCRIINVESGEALFSASYTHTGEIDALIKDGIDSIAHKLLGLPYKKKITAGPTSSSGYGATLEINSNPQGASIYIGENYFDKTPLLLQDFPAGNYDIVLKLEGYDDYQESVQLFPRGSKIMNVNLKVITGHLSLDVDPSSSKIYIDGRSSTSNVELSPGMHYLKISKAGYEDHESEFEIKKGETSFLQINLNKELGYLDLKLNPRDSEVFIDNKKVRTKDAIELVSGSHEIKIVKYFHIPKTETFSIKNRETTSLSISLKPKDLATARKRALIFPGFGHMYADSPKKGMLFITLEAVSLLGAFSMASDFMNIASDSDLAKADYLSATDPDEIQRKFAIYEKLEQDKKEKLMGSLGMGGAALAVWAWNYYDLNKSLPSIIDLSMNANGQVEFSVEF